MKETLDGLVGNSGSFSSTWTWGWSTASQVVEHGAGTSGINEEHPLLSTTSASWTSAVTFSKSSKYVQTNKYSNWPNISYHPFRIIERNFWLQIN